MQTLRELVVWTATGAAIGATVAILLLAGNHLAQTLLT
jgi:hypothetical protein